MAFTDFLEEVFRTFSEITKTGYAKYLTDLETADDDETLVLNDSSLSTLIRVDGMRTLVGSEEFNLLSNVIIDALSLLLKAQGITVAFYYAYDPTDKSDVQNNFYGMRKTAFDLQVEIGDVLDDWEAAVSRYTHGESIYIAVTTRLSSLAGYQRKNQKQKVREQQRDSVLLRDSAWSSQSIDKIATDLRTSHSATVASLVENLSRANVIAKVCNAHDAIRIMRSSLYPTGTKYAPLLPGDRFSIRFKDKIGDIYGPRDALEIHYPSIASQIFRGPFQLDGGAVQVGDRWFQGIAMEVPPETVDSINFNTLFSRINGSPNPFKWRMAIHLDGGGLDLLGIKDTFASLFYPTSSVNRRFVKAVKELRHRYENFGTTIVRFKCVFSVEANSKEELPILTSRMIAAINDWGKADAVKPLGVGQPLTVCATIPGLISKSPATGAAAPITDIPNFLPLIRPCKVWDSGVPFRTKDGVMTPYEEGSSKQASFIETGIGPLGSGKSANLNIVNLGYILASGRSRMPYLSVVDIGPGSSGVVNIIRDGLPPELKYLAVYKRIRMEKEFATNPFDVWTGYRFPTPSQKSFLVNLLTLIGTPIGHDHEGPPKNLPGMADALVEKAYQRYADNKDNSQPKIYQPRIEPDNYDVVLLDEAIIKEGIAVDGKTSWWEIVDAFFAKGMIHEAEIASRYAVPTLRDIAAMASEVDIISQYGETLTNDFRTSIRDAIKQYPIISEPTRFTLQGAKIVALDLDEVAIKGNAVAERQTSVMYMLARHIVLSRFFFEEGDIHLSPDSPVYKEYYRNFYDQLRGDHKRICFDELHRVTQNSTVAAQILNDINTVIRESRKWNIHLGFYSQRPQDIPDSIRDLSTTTFIFGANDTSVARQTGEWFSLGETAIARMGTDLRKPSKAGSTIIAKYVLDDGVAVQSLMSTVGPITLWGISSTREDADLRNRLYRDIGASQTRKILAKMYPSGSVKDVFEELRKMIVSPHMEWGIRWAGAYEKAKALAGSKPVDAMEMIYLDVMEHAKQEGLL